MTRKTTTPGFLARLWQFALETSEVAVAAHYCAPWAREARPQG